MEQKNPQFISLRWRFGLFTIILLLATVSAYLLAQNSTTAPAVDNILRQSVRAIKHEATALHLEQARTAGSIAQTAAVIAALQGDDTAGIRSLLADRAARFEFDAVILIDPTGVLVAGMQRDITSNRYVPIAMLSNTVETADEQRGDLLQVDNVAMLVTAVPVMADNQPVGAVLVGQRLPRTLATLHTSAMTDVIFYDLDQVALGSTFASSNALPLPNIVDFETTLQLDVGATPYQGLYFPLEFGEQPVGTLGVLVPADVAIVADAGRQLGGLLLAAVAAGVVVMLFLSANWVLGRVNRITQTAEALTLGQFTARTNMQPTNEVGKLGFALDQYADYVQERQDALRHSLRRQRRENERLVAVMEALPDGVIVQDLSGRVVMMNEMAGELLGSRRALRSTPDLQELTTLVTERLGPALAPGIYALGEAQQIKLDGKMLNAQAAAVVTITQQRIGTVIVLRDISEEVRLDVAREKILQQIEQEVQDPLMKLVPAVKPAPIGDFSREIRQHANTLQRMILEMRELTEGNLLRQMPDKQQPLPLDTLIWAVANEWRQVAQAQNLKLHVIIEKSGLYVLGQERRLRWAIGNIIDNAIKYTPPGGDLTLEIQADVADGRAHMRVRDNGVGIARDELPHIFDRFFRGKPVTKDGRELRIPGSGQGLSSAKQIFEAHGGSLSIKTKQWLGTAAYFTLPLTAEVSLELPQVADDLEGETVQIDVSEFKG